MKAKYELNFGDCPFIYHNNTCSCSKELFKKIMKFERNKKNICVLYVSDSGYYTPMKRVHETNKCEIFNKFNKYYSDIMSNKSSSYLELQSLYAISKNDIDKFLVFVANQYFRVKLKDTYVEKVIRKFRTNMGIALAVECNEIDEECPYFVISKDIKVSQEKV